jgi:hypothetical protein
MNYNLYILEAMACASREVWRNECGFREDTVDWDEICPEEYGALIKKAIAVVDALLKEHPEVAQYVMEAPL